ncbi:MAG: nuclear transport factor 2 family protein [Chloroflexota bacterium]|nr:nuclear transport factor 2 family protein [Chloroflexota bacterium]
MNNDQMAERIHELYKSGDLEKFAKFQNEMAADDMVQEWPQSGERIRGRKNIAAINENYPASTGTTPKVELRRVLKPGEAWIIEATIDYGDGIPVSAVSIMETGADGKVVRQTDYFANPFEAPAWRSKWVEQMEPAGVR